MSTSILLDGRTVARSKNLRGILTYSRRQPVASVRLVGPYKDGSGMLRIQWDNGALCYAPFASYKVMRDWAERRRCFKGLTLTTEVPQ